MEITEMTDEKMSKYLELNSKLQQKKNSLRKALKEKEYSPRVPPTHLTSTHTSVRLNTRNCLLN